MVRFQEARPSPFFTYFCLTKLELRHKLEAAFGLATVVSFVPAFSRFFSFLLDDIITTQLSANLFPSSLPATIHFLSVSRIVSSLREQVDDKATRCDETLLRIGRSGTERQAVKRVSSSTWCVIRTSSEKASQLKLDFRIYTRS